MSQPYQKPLPKLRQIDKPYWEAARRNELRAQRCNECGQLWFPPSEFCPNCLSQSYEWILLSGKGRIWTRIFMHQVYYKEFADDIPYNVVWVELDEGLMMTSSVVGATNEDIKVGARVAVCFDQVADEWTIPHFRLC